MGHRFSRASGVACAMLTILGLLLLASTRPASARITNIVVTSTQSPALGGASFGSVGQYEQIDGVAFGEVDPNDPLNTVITDIKLAPRNVRGMVEYSMDISILKPIDLSKSNHVLLYDVVNRGRKRSPEINVGGNATAVGDGFLESRGYILAWSGWEGDLTTGLKINLPVATRRNGAVITGRVRAEYILDAPASTQDLTAPPAYEAVSTNNAGATLTRRVHQDDPKELIPNTQWAFADCTSTPFPGVPSTLKVCLQGNFDTNHIYELVYTAKNPTVMGLGFAATRDFIAFLRGLQPLPAPPNPLAGGIQHAIIYGSSQSGRWIRTFLQLGFNESESGHQVTEGAIPHKASNRGAFNVRFAQPTRLSGTQHTETQFPGPESPSTWNPLFDPLSGVSGGQLDRCRASNTCPKITHTITDTEYWQAAMSLNTTDPLGTRDVGIPPEVRIYLFAATQHGGGDPRSQPPAVLPGFPGSCQLRSNPGPFVYQQRALLEALREWIVDGTAPPPSAFPKLRRGELAKPEDVSYPFIPAVNFTVEGVAIRKFFQDRGPRFNVEDISGVMEEPAVPGAEYGVLVPTVDDDGNTVGGIRHVNVEVPVGTHLGWNVRKAGFSEGDSCDLTGGFVPFFKTRAQRLAADDPRPSLEERYPTHGDYVAAVIAAANRLVRKRLLLPEDAATVIGAANAAPVP